MRRGRERRGREELILFVFVEILPSRITLSRPNLSTKSKILVREENKRREEKKRGKEREEAKEEKTTYLLLSLLGDYQVNAVVKKLIQTIQGPNATMAVTALKSIPMLAKSGKGKTKRRGEEERRGEEKGKGGEIARIEQIVQIERREI